MTQYISKSAVVAEIDRKLESISNAPTNFALGRKMELANILSFINTLEVKEVKEEPVSKDLEDYAKKESESFAEREYEIDYIDRNALAKGYYWGCIAGAQWQKQQLIDKACEWLKAYRQDSPDGTGYIAGIVNDKTIEEFKKAMEE